MSNTLLICVLNGLITDKREKRQGECNPWAASDSII